MRMAADYSDRVSCVFCKDLSAAGGLVFEDDRVWVLLHPDWSPRGHAMVVAKAHVENASDLDESAWLQLARVWHRAERVLLDATGADRAIILKLGIMTPHLHVHIYPMSAQATREEVFDAIEGKKNEPRDEEFVRVVRAALDTLRPAE
jgi:diadenosine tetraphosphate (Ap4A) HIT family hydrolase